MKRSYSTSFLCDMNNLELIQQSENNVIMFGLIGHGITTLLNKACGTNFETAESSFSYSRDLQFSFSIRGDMAIIDFPWIKFYKGYY